MESIRQGESLVNNSHILEEIDAALDKDSEERAKSLAKRTTRIKQTWGVSKLSQVLRMLGALLVVASSGIFMLQGWEQGGFISRYYSFLLFTAALTTSGFVCGLKVKEDKGARTFLAIAVGMVPVHFAQLGAFWYSGFLGRIDAARYPSFALWVAPDFATALYTTIVALVVLAPVIYLGFKALVRKTAGSLTMLYLVTSSTLLIPTRDPIVISLVGIVLSVLLSYFDGLKLKMLTGARTKEGIISRFLLWTPVILIFSRNILLYGSDMVLIGSLCLCASAFMFFLLGNNVEGDDGTLYQVLAQIPAGLGWSFISLELIHSFSLGKEIVIPFVVLPIAFMLFIMAEYAKDYQSFFRGSAISLATLGLGANLLIAPTLITGFLALLIGMFSLVYGMSIEKRYHCVTGCLTTLCALGYYVREAIMHISMSPWMSLAILGGLTIFAASYLERNYSTIGERFSRLRKNVKSWN